MAMGPPAPSPSPPPPVQQERKIEAYDSSDDSSMDDGLRLNEPMPAILPRSPPPPTAPGRRKKVRVRETPAASLSELPRISTSIPHPPPIPEDDPSQLPPPKTPVSPLSPLLARVKSKRKTIMERVEGWWDLGLLDKRQTLFGGNGSAGSRRG